MITAFFMVLLIALGAGAVVNGVDPAWIALIATVCGGVGLKVVENWLGRSKVKIDDAAQIRDELRLQIAALREENAACEADRDKWRKEYYDLRDKMIGFEPKP